MNKATIRRKESWEYLLELNPDVALLQEVNSIPDFIQNEFECLYRKAIKKNGQSQHFGTAILVKGKIIKPIQLSSEWDWVNQELNLFSGNLVAAEIILGNEFRAQTISVHSPAWCIDPLRLMEVEVNEVKLKKNSKVWGTELVWDYPRPPRLEPTDKHLKIIFNGETIAEANRAYRVLETSHPPVYYFPSEDVRMEFLTEAANTSFCEWKGRAGYYALQVGEKRIENAAWFYANPTREFAEIKNYIAFYPSKMDACFVDDELVETQEGDFYGGWITKDIVGPFKGAAGTWGW